MIREAKIFRDWREFGFYDAMNDAMYKQRRCVVVCNGCFDLLHVGHVSLLRWAKQTQHVKKMSNWMVAAVNTDATVSKLKGENRPIVPFDHRLRMLASIRYVDAVVGFSEDTLEQLYRAHLPHFIVKGSEYKDAPLPEWCTDAFLFAPMFHDYHTTSLSKKI